MPNVFLVGFMACGKSRVGAALARRMGCRFLDLDEVVEQRVGMTIPEIFSSQGESAFRAAETDALRRAVRHCDVVVATGGGTYCSVRNRQLIRDSGAMAVYLDVPWPAIVARLPVSTSERPMFTSPEAARELLEDRRGHYEHADVTLTLTGAESVDTVVDRVLTLLPEAVCAT